MLLVPILLRDSLNNNWKEEGLQMPMPAAVRATPLPRRRRR